MRLSVSLLPSLRPVDPSTDVAVVIDVLRATSVMTTALANGASKIVTCEQISEAKELASEIAGQTAAPALLCGERNCKPIEGFDHGNSPSEYSLSAVKDRTLVLTTTNGTRAIAAANVAKRMIISSFLNLTATVDYLRGIDSVHLVCAGTNSQITAEDVLLAGAVVDRLSKTEPIEFDDDAALAQGLWQSWFQGTSPTPQTLANRLAQTQGGRNLIKVGYSLDLELCAQIDLSNVVVERIDHSPNTFALKAN